MTQDECPVGPPNPDEIEALYPENTTPQVRNCSISALCHYGVTPTVMTGALRQVLIQHFGDTRNILNATLRGRLEREGVWREDVNTGIVIESLHRWRPELTSAKPALILKENEWQWDRRGIGDQSGDDVFTARRFFQGYWNGSHTIFALATESVEAQLIAIEAMKCLLWFESEISQQLNLQRFIPVSIGAVATLKEARENYVVPIVVAYTVPEAWYLQEDAPKLKQLVFKTSVVFDSC